MKKDLSIAVLWAVIELLLIVIGIMTVMELTGYLINELILRLDTSRRVIRVLLKWQKILQKPQVLLANLLGLQSHSVELSQNYRLFFGCTVRNGNVLYKSLCMLVTLFYPIVLLMALILGKGAWCVTIPVVLFNCFQSRGLNQLYADYFMSFVSILVYTVIVWTVGTATNLESAKNLTWSLVATTNLELFRTLRDVLLQSTVKFVLISLIPIVSISVYLKHKAS